MTDRDFYLLIRQALLMAVDAIEKRLEITPTTAEIRRAARKERDGV